MSQRVIHDLGCSCGRHFRRALYRSLNVTQQPGLRYGVLGGVLNVVQCPSCERMARVDVPVLYIDATRDRPIYVYPAGGNDGTDMLEGQTEVEGVQSLHALDLGLPTLENVVRPTVMFGIDRLADYIAGALNDDEEMGSMAFDVRPGPRSERAARILAARLAEQADGYVHSWREGGRLHLQLLAPGSRLEALVVDD